MRKKYLLIIELVKSLNTGNSGDVSDRVGIAAMQYEQLEKLVEGMYEQSIEEIYTNNKGDMNDDE